MNPAIEGALIGAGVGFFLVATEYLFIKKAVSERERRLKRKIEFDVTERRRIMTITRFAVILPAAFALGFWFVWG